MNLLFALICLSGYVVTIAATLAAGLLRGKPQDFRWHVRQLSRLGLVGGCAFSIARLLWQPVLTARPEQALLIVSLSIIMLLRAYSEVRRQRAEAITS